MVDLTVRPAADAALRNRLEGWLYWMFARPEGEVVRYDVDKHRGEHQPHDDLKPPVPVNVLPRMVARMLTIPRFASFILNCVPASDHLHSDQKRSRRNGTPAVFCRVGLLLNGSPGHWPDYPLFSHPSISMFCREPIFREAPDHFIVRFQFVQARLFPIEPEPLCPGIHNARGAFPDRQCSSICSSVFPLVSGTSR